jgi:hypothetical protein
MSKVKIQGSATGTGTITVVAPDINTDVSITLPGNISTLSDVATIATDLSVNSTFTVTLGGNRTMANPTNLIPGQTGSIFIVQDGTGSRTLAWGSYWNFINGTAPTLSTNANSVDRVDYVVRTAGSIHAVFTGNYS